jgi:hypothetical protein
MPPICCSCGKELTPWAYKVQDIERDQLQYECWEQELDDQAADGVIYAASREDALAWITDTRDPEHEIKDSDGGRLQVGNQYVHNYYS